MSIRTPAERTETYEEWRRAGTKASLVDQIVVTLRWLERPDVTVIEVNETGYSLLIFLQGILTEAERDAVKDTVEAIRPAAATVLVIALDVAGSPLDAQHRAAISAAYLLGGIEALEPWTNGRRPT